MGSTSVGTNSAGTALGDHIKVGNSCVSVGSWSNTDHCYMGIALGYQSNTSNESEKHHTATAYSFCAGMGSRIEGAFCIGIGRGVCGRRLRAQHRAWRLFQAGSAQRHCDFRRPRDGHPVWFVSPGVTSGEMMLARQALLDFHNFLFRDGIVGQCYPSEAGTGGRRIARVNVLCQQIQRV